METLAFQTIFRKHFFRSFVRCPIIKVRKPSTEPLAAIAEPGGPWIQAVLPPSPGPVGANDLYSISEADIEAPSSEEPVVNLGARKKVKYEPSFASQAPSSNTPADPAGNQSKSLLRL
jgi:hypothetical protein